MQTQTEYKLNNVTPAVKRVKYTQWGITLKQSKPSSRGTSH